MVENKNIIDFVEKGVENIIRGSTSKELLKLKKKLAKDITKKLGITNKDVKKFTIDYLTNDGTLLDTISDEFTDRLTNKVLKKEGLGLGLIAPELDAIKGQLEKYKQDINNAHNKKELENLSTTILNEIGNNNSTSSQKKESNDSTTDSTTTQTSATESSTTNGQASTDSSDNKQGSTSSSEATASSSTTEKAKVAPSSKSYEIDHFNITVSPESKKLWENLKGKEKPDLEPFACALKAYNTEKAKGSIKNTKYLTVVDFTKNQLTNNRFFVINLDTNTVEYSEKCGHGAGSGDQNYAKHFSNISGSNQSSLGARFTANNSRPNGKGSRKGNFPQGLENSNNKLRGIAIHPVKSLVYKSGKPTSLGCFTLAHTQSEVNEILNKIQGRSFLFSYAKSEAYFKQSKYFQKDSSGNYAA